MHEQVTEQFVALGVRFDLSEITEAGIFSVGNKPGRVEKILQTIDEALTENVFPRPLIDILKGQLRYARAQCFGICGAEQLRCLGGDRWPVARKALEW